MAHPQHARTPKLNALLIGKRTVPSGCRVLNVSQQGMSLQCDPDGRLLTFISGDTVDIYLSVQHTNGHNKFTIPAIVSHVDESTIDVVFHCTDPELAGLIESYRTSESHNLEASIDHRQTSRKESAVKPVVVNESVSYNAQPDESTSQGNRSFYSGLFTLFITSLVLLGAYYYVSSINKRLNTLETASRSHTDELAEVQTQVFSSRLQDGRYASLNARMKALTDAFQSFEKRVTQTLPQDPIIVTTATHEQLKEAAVVMAEKPPAVKAGTPSPQKHPAIETQAAAPTAITPVKTAPKATPSTTSQGKPDDTETKQILTIKQEPAVKPVAAPVVTPVAIPTRTEKPAITHTGPWVINLLSSTDKAYVDNTMADMRLKGFDVVVKGATVKGRQYWRLQAPGYRSITAAKAAAEPMKEQLKIKDVWILKR